MMPAQVLELDNFGNTSLEEKVADILEANPSTMVRTMAKNLGLSEGTVVEALPADMRLFIPGCEFVSVWETMSTWQKVTFMAETSGGILEIPGPLPKGKMGHGMYNLMDKNIPLGGHFFTDSIAAIWLISKPAFGRESHSIQFFTTDGQQCFAVYLGRGENYTIIDSVKQGYLELWQKYSTKEEGGEL